MFSSQTSAASPFSFGLPSGAVGDVAVKKARPLTAEEKYQQAVVTANVFVRDSQARIQKETAKIDAVANSQYWFYGYFGGNAIALMAACLSLGSRVPFLRSYSGLISLGGGYVGANFCIGVHSRYLLKDVIETLDKQISEAKRMDEQTDRIVPYYREEAERLTRIKYELMPELPEAVEAREARGNEAAQTLDARVDDLVEAYNKRRAALKK